MEEYKENNQKKIEIIEGDSKTLNISEVKDNLAFEVEQKQSPDKDKIVIPKKQN